MARCSEARAARWLVLLGLSSGACLPNDKRPPPGSVLVTVSSDGVAAAGIPASETLDGWSISFDRLLVVLGSVSLDGDGCDTYSEASYTRLFDMKTLGAQKVSISYAIGHCDFGFRVSNPNADTIVGEGATEADKGMMRTPGSDAFNDQAGVSIYVRGHATLGDTTKTFEWPFRFRARYEECAASPDAGAGRGIGLAGGVAQTVDLRLRAGALFENNQNPVQARTRFQVFADADSVYGNHDGQITLNELDRVPLTDAGFTDLDRGSVGIDAGYANRLHRHHDAASEGELSLEDYVYLVLFPSMVRYGEDGTCSVSVQSRGVGN